MQFKRQIYLSLVLSSLLLAETNTTKSQGGGHLSPSVSKASGASASSKTSSASNTSANSKASSDASSLNTSNISGTKSSLDTNSTINSTILNPATSSNEPYRLDATVITANAFAFQSGEVIGTEQLSTIPNGNGDITSVLKILPNVQFDNNQMNSNTPGEIDPANVSISGGLYYQNSFIVDGMSINNDLSGVKQGSSDPGNDRTATMGRSQGMNIDTFLLKSIKVQDSNIGAAYGGFTGGVIEAETREAEKDFGANFAYQISQGNANDGSFSLTKYHTYGDKQSFLNSSAADNQPKFIKHSFRSSLESKINDKLGVIASFTTTQSFIPLKAYRSYNEDGDPVENRPETVTQKRQSYNFFVKTNYQTSDDVALSASYGYMPQFGVFYQEDAKDSRTTMRNGGHMLNTEAIINNSLGFLTANVSFSYMEESRRSDSSKMKDWATSPSKNWGTQPDTVMNIAGSSIEGSFGDEDNKQSDLSLKLTQNFEPYYDDTWESGFNIGAELSYTYAYFKRLEDVYWASVPTTINPGEICRDEWCDSTPYEDGYGTPNSGQYFTHLEEYRAGQTDIDNTQFGTFIENESKFDLGNKGDIATRLGLRMDYDTYMQKAPIAPRFSANYTAPWGKDEFKLGTQFTLGANRYYGRNMYSFKLNQNKDKLVTSYDRFNGPNQDWWSDPNVTKLINADSYDFRQLKIPYDDEIMFGVVQEIGLFNVNTKYIHRYGRDQVRRYRIGEDANQNPLYAYDNKDKSDTDVITLTIGNNTPFMYKSMSNYFNFAFDWTNTKRSFNDYQSDFINPAEDDWVDYNGQLYRLSELPVTNFAQPLSFRFSTTHGFKLLGTDMTLNNFFRVRMPYNATVWARDADGDFIGSGTENDPRIYKDERIPTRFTWDLRLGIEKQVYKKNTLYVNVDVYNVLDRVNTTVQSGGEDKSSVLTYEVGRQFWLEIGYRY